MTVHLHHAACACRHTLRLLSEARALPNEEGILQAVQAFIAAWRASWERKWRAPSPAVLPALLMDTFALDLRLEREREAWRKQAGWKAPFRGVREVWRDRVRRLRSLDAEAKGELAARLRGRGAMEAEEGASLEVVISALSVPEAAEVAFREAFSAAFAEAMKDGTADVVAHLGVGADWALRNPEAVADIDRYAGYYGDRLSRLLPVGQQVELREALISGLDEGLGAEQMGDAIREKYAGLHDYEAERIARTESVRARTEATREVYAAEGVQQVVWVVADSPCPICDPRAGMVLPMDSTELPPLHPNCRCTVVPQQEDLDRMRRQILIDAGVPEEEIAPWEPGPAPRYRQRPRE